MTITFYFNKLSRNRLIPLIFQQKRRMSSEKPLDRKQYVLPLIQPVSYLDASTAFTGLSDKEKLYAHHLSKACWTGGLVTLFQTSPESGPLFILLHKVFSALPPNSFKEASLANGFTEDEITSFFVYTAGFFSNSGNFKGFGDTKFVPGIPENRLKELLQSTPVWDEIEKLWEKVYVAMYDLSPGNNCLGFPPHGSTTYFSKNCNESDNEQVMKWLKNKGIESWNTRVFKSESEGQKMYEIRLAAQNVAVLDQGKEENTSFSLTSGDYSPLMGIISQHIEKTIPYAANDNQSAMLKEYVNSFTYGSLQAHKDGSRLWIKDKGPAVESYIGFIETYRDPAGVRGEFEGFVAIVNREMSAKFTTLVNSAQKMLQLLPWSKAFEKDNFLRPDFTSLDVLTFAGSGVPAGINIPNYDDVRQHEGFKNVSLGNIIPASYQQKGPTPFLTEADAELLKKYRVVSFEVQVGLHELLGHGSGKLFTKSKEGTLNFESTLLNPLDGNAINSYYEPGDTYDSVFGPISSAYEECRAEAVGLYLSLEPSSLAIFGHTGDQALDVMYVNWLSLVYSAIFSLEMWDSNRGWLQSHSQARFAITKVLIEAGVVSVKEVSGNDLLITLDRESFLGAGRNAIGNFLLKLQVYKATANVEAAKTMFNHYSKVDEPWCTWRDIVIANKKPRMMFAQPNLVRNANEVVLKSYESSPAGLIQSWIERYEHPESIYKAMLDIIATDAIKAKN